MEIDYPPMSNLVGETLGPPLDYHSSLMDTTDEKLVLTLITQITHNRNIIMYIAFEHKYKQ